MRMEDSRDVEAQIRRLYGWSPPLLPTLPAGEARAAHSFTVYDDGDEATPYPPQTAPGFTNAVRLGMLPAAVSPTPPQTLPGMTAQTWIRLALASFLLPFATAIFSDGVAFLGFIAGLTGAICCVVKAAKVNEAENAAGYTSRANREGMWRMASGNRVVREPDRTVPPPGWYPSPFFPGLLQKWEGPGWRGLSKDTWQQHPDRYFRWPDQPFL